ncbi:hypothetical protein L6164_003292 [Bauhinia variegata]|uniref:Uncharacterized protein n=1 Tax=Bauhinia variegata TaxID=167791 RepID=A0ACB9Q0W6_BAUVA|nr:hypothetical protein L6164_003292 [Bauhinia variegata]
MTSEADSDCRKRRRVQSATVIDPSKKSQCWVLLKRLLIHPDGGAFKKPISPKVLDLETIQSTLLKGLYSRSQDFADDIRTTFSHAMESNPPRHELHKKARELSRIFESNWESLQEKWAAEKGETKKNSKVPDFSQEKKAQKDKNKGCSGSQHFVDSSKTDSAVGFVEKRKHDGFRDSQHFDDATKSQFRQEKHRRGSKTDSTDGPVRTSSGDYLRSNFQGQVHSTHSASQHVFTVGEKWPPEKGEGMKNSEATVFSQEKKTQKTKDEACSDSQHYDDSSKTYSKHGYVKRHQHDSFRDSQHFDDATKSQFREKKQRSYLRFRGYRTDSNDGHVGTPSGDYLRSKFHGQARSTRSASRVFTMEKWATENGEGKKNSEAPLFSKKEKTQQAKNSYSQHIDDSPKTHFTNGFVKKRKHDSFRDSQHFDDATKSQYRHENHRSYLRFRGSKTDSTDGSVSSPSGGNYLRSKFQGQAATHSSSQHVIMVISDSKLEAKEGQKSLHNFCEAASQKKQEEDEARIRAAEIKTEREASRRRLQEMERSVDIEDNLQTYRELYSLCGFTLKYHTLKGFGLKLKPDWD